MSSTNGPLTLPQVRRVVRQVSSSFWLIREVLRYGKDCEIVSPEAVRDRLKQELEPLCQLYGLLPNANP